MARPLGAFVARLFQVEPARQAQLDMAAREAAIFRMKHFIVRRACKRYPEDKLPADDPAELRTAVAELCATFPDLVVERRRGADAGGGDRRPLGEREGGRVAAGARSAGALGRGAPVRPGGARGSGRLGLVSSRARGRLRRSGPAATSGREAGQHHRGAGRAPSPARWLRPHRRADVAPGSGLGVRLLHVLPRAGEGLLLEGDARQAGRGEEEPASASRCAAVRSTRRSARCTSCGATATRSPRWRWCVVDNPMVPGTGHRICNDCMKACIFQKQEPVNIPQAETGVLTDVLGTAAGATRSMAC